jgi:hypothetical protein
MKLKNNNKTEKAPVLKPKTALIKEKSALAKRAEKWWR